jgi:hypothetical protein
MFLAEQHLLGPAVRSVRRATHCTPDRPSHYKSHLSGILVQLNAKRKLNLQKRYMTQMTGSNSLCFPVLRIPLKANLNTDPCCDRCGSGDPTFHLNGYPDPYPVPRQIYTNLRPIYNPPRLHFSLLKLLNF